MMERKNVYQHIAENNFKIFGLVCLFPIALTIFVYLGFWIVGQFVESPEEYQDFMNLFWDLTPWIVLVCTGLTVLSVLFGDKMMLSFAGAHLCRVIKQN